MENIRARCLLSQVAVRGQGGDRAVTRGLRGVFGHSASSGLLLSDVRIRAGLGLAGERKKKETIAAQIDKHREQIGGQIVTCPVLVLRLDPEAPPTVNSV